MVACDLREAGVLILVFAPLYVLLEKTSERPLDLQMFFGILVSGLVFLLLGIVLERVRREQ
jgi:hypothetical protein